MSASPENDLVSVFRTAAQSLLGGLLVWVLTCTLAGAIAKAATAQGLEDVDWFWALAWVWHLAVAGIELWGLLVLLIHAFCLTALVYGTDRVLRVIVIAFIAQLTTSLIVVVTFDGDTLPRALTIWIPLAGISIIYLIGSFARQRRAGATVGNRGSSARRA